MILRAYEVNRVVIIEDDTELRESLADYLVARGEDVTGVGSAIELYQLDALNTYDVALVDVNLPHYDGLSISRHLAENTGIAVILMTVRGAVEDRVKGYDAGADLYLVKPIDCEELAAAIKSLARRRKRELRHVQAEAMPVWNVDRRLFSLAAPSGRQVSLTRKEAQLLELLAISRGKIVARAHVLEVLGYDPVKGDGRALDVAISRLRSKVQAESKSTLPLQTVQGAGYVFSGTIRLS